MVDSNTGDQWLLASAERELVMTKNRATPSIMARGIRTLLRNGTCAMAGVAS